MRGGLIVQTVVDMQDGDVKRQRRFFDQVKKRNRVGPTAARHTDRVVRLHAERGQIFG